MTRRPLRPIPEQGRLVQQRKISHSEKLEETITIALVAMLFYPAYAIARLFKGDL